MLSTKVILLTISCCTCLVTESTTDRVPHDFDSSAESNATSPSVHAAEGDIHPDKETGWWNGPHVCLSRTATVSDAPSNDSVNIDGGLLKGRLDRSVFTVCREDKTIRICRTVKSVNATATENVLITYACCAGFALHNHTCSSDNKENSSTSDNESTPHAVVPPETERADSIKSSLSDEKQFSSYFQQMLKDSAKSQALFLKALDTDQPQSVEDAEDDDAQSAFQRMAPKEVVDRSKVTESASSTVKPIFVTTLAPNTSSISQRNAHEKLQFSIYSS
ncbi:uncharacterized protein LOC129586143 isoform X2 [Paramacrobiotus metropolitanus]|uniref:uncharacterized protein LOC129586143 isoform X2 n=1 Tax=Paramacrobiotus metropolitanus TaxID=2943436 RepID=UPI0024464F51|nr:uncharacterized protein LOC129586143 isoform X2 [Paramacrobiotus metropolitanus]